MWVPLDPSDPVLGKVGWDRRDPKEQAHSLLLSASDTAHRVQGLGLLEHCSSVCVGGGGGGEGVGWGVPESWNWQGLGQVGNFLYQLSSASLQDLCLRPKLLAGVSCLGPRIQVGGDVPGSYTEQSGRPSEGSSIHP